MYQRRTFVLEMASHKKADGQRTAQVRHLSRKKKEMPSRKRTATAPFAVDVTTKVFPRIRSGVWATPWSERTTTMEHYPCQPRRRKQSEGHPTIL